VPCRPEGGNPDELPGLIEKLLPFLPPQVGSVRGKRDMGKDKGLNIENRLKDQKERVDIRKTTCKKLRLTNADLWLRINLKLGKYYDYARVSGYGQYLSLWSASAYQAMRG